MNPIKVIKNVSGQTYGELESSLKAMGVDIKATTLQNRYKSTSSHSKMTAEEMRKVALALTADVPPEGAEDFVNEFAEAVYVINELLGTNIVLVGGDSSSKDIISDDWDEVEIEEVEIEEVDDDWSLDDLDLDLDSLDDDELDFDSLDDDDDEKEQVTDDSADDLLSLILDDDVPEVPDTEEDNLFSVLDEEPSEPLSSTPENFENQAWLDSGDEFDIDSVQI